MMHSGSSGRWFYRVFIGSEGQTSPIVLQLILNCSAIDAESQRN